MNKNFKKYVNVSENSVLPTSPRAGPRWKQLYMHIGDFNNIKPSLTAKLTIRTLPGVLNVLHLQHQSYFDFLASNNLRTCELKKFIENNCCIFI